jgi:hypothetical protein
MKQTIILVLIALIGVAAAEDGQYHFDGQGRYYDGGGVVGGGDKPIKEGGNGIEGETQPQYQNISFDITISPETATCILGHCEHTIIFTNTGDSEYCFDSSGIYGEFPDEIAPTITVSGEPVEESVPICTQPQEETFIYVAYDVPPYSSGKWDFNTDFGGDVLNIDPYWNNSDPNAILHYTFDSDNNVTVYDSGLYKRNGTYNNAYVQTTGCLSGSCAYFNNTLNATVTVPNTASLNGMSSAALCEWIKPTGNLVNTPAIYVETTGTSTCSRFSQFLLPTGYYRFTLRNLLNDPCGTACYVDSTVAIPLNLWTNIAASYNGTNLAIWINGTSAGTAVCTGTFGLTSTAGIRLGTVVGTPTANLFQGYMDELYLFNQSLLTSDAVSCYNAGLNITTTTTTTTTTIAGPTTTTTSTTSTTTTTLPLPVVHLEYIVDNFNTLAPIDGANVTLVSPYYSGLTDSYGVRDLTVNYGLYNVTVSRSGYSPYQAYGYNASNDTVIQVYLIQSSHEGIIKLTINDLTLAQHDFCLYFDNGRLQGCYGVNDTIIIHNNMNYTITPKVEKVDLLNNPASYWLYLPTLIGVAAGIFIIVLMLILAVGLYHRMRGKR